MKITGHLSQVQLGTPQRHGDISVFPLFDFHQPDLAYQTMDPSLMRGDLEINEISQGGEVPLLEANNRLDQFILLLDSEEIRGAKQNRVLNTSILLPEKSRTTIPVSCTESGRWEYATAGFQPSGTMMPKKSRTNKMKSVTSTTQKIALACAAGAPAPPVACCYSSDQSEVWDDVASLQAETHVSSSTSAMSDVYEAMADKIKKITGKFDLHPNQKGLLVMKDGEIMGFDLLSQSEAYAELHEKLLGSYVMDSTAEQEPRAEQEIDEQAVASTFLQEAATAEGDEHESVGKGTDVRFKTENLSGSALMHDEQVVHTSFLRSEPQSPHAPDLPPAQL